MSDAVVPAPAERGWGKLLLALAAFLLVPPLLLRSLLPVEFTLWLLLPALAACCLVGWWAGGRLLLVAGWVGLTAWVLTRVSAAAPHVGFWGSLLPVEGEYANLLRGWALLLAGAFGLLCLLGAKHVFFSRAITSVGVALMLVLGLTVRGPFTPDQARQALRTEFARRNSANIDAFRAVAKEYPETKASFGKLGSWEEGEAALRTTSEAGIMLAPSLLLLESLIALALAWALYHRISRARLGAPLGPLKDFRFNDQLVWGLIAGLTIVFLPALEFVGWAGRNLLVFFGALYAIRGFAVLSWFMQPRAFRIVLMVGGTMLLLPVLSPVAVLGFLLLALAAFGLGLGDTWADWRRRPRPTT